MSAAVRNELAALPPSKQAQMRTQDLQAMDQQMAQHATAGSGTRGPDALSVICNGNYGLYLVARRVVQCLCPTCKSIARRHPNEDNYVVSPTEFERHSGMPTAKKWRQSIRVAHAGEPDMPLGRWLEQHGFLCSNAPGSSSSLAMQNSLQQQMSSTRGRSGSPAAVSCGSYRQQTGRQKNSPQQSGADDMDIDQTLAAPAAHVASQRTSQPCVKHVNAVEAASNALKVTAAVAARLPINTRGPVEVIQPLVAAGRYSGAASARAQGASSPESKQTDHHAEHSDAAAAHEAAALQAAAEAEAAAADAEGRVFKQQKQCQPAVPTLLEIPCGNLSAAALRDGSGPVVLEEAAAAAARGDDSLWMRSPVRKTPRGCSRLLAEIAGILPAGAAAGVAAGLVEDRSAAVVKLLGQAVSVHSPVTRHGVAAAAAETGTAGAVDPAQLVKEQQTAVPKQAATLADDEQQQQGDLEIADEEGEEEPGIAVGPQHQAAVPNLQLLPSLNAVQALLELKKAGTPGPSESEALATAIEEKARADLLPRDAVEDVWERSTGLALERAQRQRKPPGWQAGFIDPLKPHGQTGAQAASAATEPPAVHSTTPHNISGDDGSDEGRPTWSSRKRGSKDELQHQQLDTWHHQFHHHTVPPSCQFYCPHGLLVKYRPQLLPLHPQQLDQDAPEQPGKRQRCNTSSTAANAAAASGAGLSQSWGRRSSSADGKGMPVSGILDGSSPLCCPDPSCIRNNPAMAAAAAACSLCAAGVPAGWGCGSGSGLTRGPAGPELLSWLLLTPAAASTGIEPLMPTDKPQQQQQQTQGEQQQVLETDTSAPSAATEEGTERDRQPQAAAAAVIACSEPPTSASPLLDAPAVVSDAGSSDAEDDMAVDAAAAIQTLTPSAGKYGKGLPTAIASKAKEADATPLLVTAAGDGSVATEPAEPAPSGLPTSSEEPSAIEPAGAMAGESAPADNSAVVAAASQAATATASGSSPPAAPTAPADVDTRGVVEVRIVLDGCVFIGQLQEVGRLDLARARISAAQDPIRPADSHEPPAHGTKCALCHKPETPGCHADQASAAASCGMSSRGLGPLMPVAMAYGSATSATAGKTAATGRGQDEQQQEGVHVEWVHRQCALWSPEVYPDNRGKLMFLPNAVRRGRATRCSQCGLKGATLKCADRRCMLHFHLECAREAGCTLIPEPYTIACLAHEPMQQPPSAPAMLAGQQQPLAASPADLLLPEHLSLRCKTAVDRAHRASGEVADLGSSGALQYVCPHSSPVHKGAAAGGSRRPQRQPPGSRAGSPMDIDGRTFFMSGDRERLEQFYSAGSYFSDGTPHAGGPLSNGLCSEGPSGAAVGDELDGQREEELGAAILLSGFKRAWNGQSRLQRQSNPHEFDTHDREGRQQHKAPGSPDVRSHRATTDLTPRAAAGAATRAGSRGTSGGARRSGSRPGGSAVRSTSAHQLHDSRGRFMSHAQANALGLLQRNSSGMREDGGATPAGSAIADAAADSGVDTCGTPGYSTAADADGALSDASAGTPPVGEMDLGGTTGQPGRAGRCAVCVIQRKGKCGTESAPKKCLRRQLQQQQKHRAAAAKVAAAAAAAAEARSQSAAVPAGVLTAATGVPASIAAAAEFHAAAAAAAAATSSAAPSPAAAPATSKALPQVPAAVAEAAAA